MQFVFTVCDNAAAEVCPVWPGQPMTAHWGIEDPAAASGSDEDKARAFTKAFRELDARIKIFTSLRLEMLDRMALQRQLNEIGSTRAGVTVPEPSGEGGRAGFVTTMRSSCSPRSEICFSVSRGPSTSTTVNEYTSLISFCVYGCHVGTLSVWSGS